MTTTKNKKPIVLVDSREKFPFDFQSDSEFAGVEHIKLDTGDYSLKGSEHLICIERKKKTQTNSISILLLIKKDSLRKLGG
jgi:ERCC4-type nuclease